MRAEVSLATIAEYFRLGLEIGLLMPEEAVAWADAKIAASDTPPDGLIEVALSKGLAPAIEALSEVPGDRNRQVAGRGLLGLLSQSIPKSEEELQLTIRRAMHIARHAELGETTYYRFDMIDDELSLARTNVYGSVDQCRTELAAQLAEYKVLEVVRGA